MRWTLLALLLLALPLSGCPDESNDDDDLVDDDDSAGDDDDSAGDDDDDSAGDDDDDSAALDSDGDGAPDWLDCDDTDPTVFPGGVEVCDGLDNDCDGVVPSDEQDGDGDGYSECGGDCDDGDAATNPSATETYYDGEDADCSGGSDYDADGDGDDALDWGGGDCDDTDPSVFGGNGCRPVAGCVHPDPITLAANDSGGVSDIFFGPDCSAYLGTIRNGADWVTIMDSTGATTSVGGTAAGIGACYLDPVTGVLITGHSGATQEVRYDTGGSLVSVAISGSSYLGSGQWSNGYMDNAPSSIAVDSAGCVWVPNWGSLGVLACVELDGTVTTVDLAATIETVALDSADSLHVSLGDTLYLVEPATGGLTAVFSATDTILDVVFDYNDDIYVESADQVIAHVPGDGNPASVLPTSPARRSSPSPRTAGWCVASETRPGGRPATSSSSSTDQAEGRRAPAPRPSGGAAPCPGHPPSCPPGHPLGRRVVIVAGDGLALALPPLAGAAGGEEQGAAERQRTQAHRSMPAPTGHGRPRPPPQPGGLGSGQSQRGEHALLHPPARPLPGVRWLPGGRRRRRLPRRRRLDRRGRRRLDRRGRR